MRKVLILTLLTILLVSIVNASIPDCDGQYGKTYQQCKINPDYSRVIDCQSFLQFDGSRNSALCKNTIQCVINERIKDLVNQGTLTSCPRRDQQPTYSNTDDFEIPSVEDINIPTDYEDESVVEPEVDVCIQERAFINQLNQFISLTKDKNCFETSSEWSTASAPTRSGGRWSGSTSTRLDICRKCSSDISSGGGSGPCKNKFSSTASFSAVECPPPNSQTNSYTTNVEVQFSLTSTTLSTCDSCSSCLNACNDYNTNGATYRSEGLSLDSEKMKMIRCYFNPSGTGCPEEEKEEEPQQTQATGKCDGRYGWCIVNGACVEVDSEAHYSSGLNECVCKNFFGKKQYFRPWNKKCETGGSSSSGSSSIAEAVTCFKRKQLGG